MIATAEPKSKYRKSHTWLCDALLELGLGESVYATGVPWSTYTGLADFRDEHRSGVRITFDQGRIELVSPRYRHEKPISRLVRVISQLARAFNQPFQTARTTTLRQEGAEKGLEPDDCCYLANAPAIQNVEDIDLDVHPPPDLAIEVDSTNSSVPKEPIFASMGVPELWRFKDKTVVIRLLGADRQYVTSANSLAFPLITSESLTKLLRETDTKFDENEADDFFRAWAMAQKLAATS